MHDALIASAYQAAGIFALLSIASIAMRWVNRPLELALACVAAIAGAAAIILAGRPIRARTGFDVNFMVSRVWLIGGFGLFVPVFAPLMLFMGVWHLVTKSIGGYQTSDEEGGNVRYYPKMSLDGGEGKPLGVVFLVLGTVWAAAVALAIYP